MSCKDMEIRIVLTIITIAKLGNGQKRQFKLNDEREEIEKTAIDNLENNPMMRELYLRLRNEEAMVFYEGKAGPPEEQEAHVRQKRNTINDQHWNLQWSLQPVVHPPMNVYDSWSRGYTGKGVVIGIVDGGTDPDHIDLVDNFDVYNSYDYVNDRGNTELDVGFYGNGVECAGLAVAQDNTECIIGVAHDAKYVAIKVLTGVPGVVPEDTLVSKGLSHRRDFVDIYSNSWGPIDDGFTLDDNDTMGTLTQKALLDGVTMGRDGKGSIFLFATGIGGNVGDNCNANGYMSSPYIIAIGSSNNQGQINVEEELCSAKFAVTYGGHFAQPVPTTSDGDACTGSFNGSFAATPIAAGIIALVLEANNNLTWRDIQHLIVETAVPFPGYKYTANGGGHYANDVHGFGLMNAKAMIKAAKTWTSVGEMLTCYGDLETPDDVFVGTGVMSATTEIKSCNIHKVEFVTLTFSGKFLYRENATIFLTSARRTDVVMMAARHYDTEYADFTFNFSTPHFWGEYPKGTWYLHTLSDKLTNQMFLYEWRLTITGTAEVLETTTPSPNATEPTTEAGATEEKKGGTSKVTIGAFVYAGVVTIILICVIVYYTFCKPKSEPKDRPKKRRPSAALTVNRVDVTTFH